MRNLFRALRAGALCAGLMLAPGLVASSELEVTVSTDRPEYFQGQTVTVLVQACNPTDHEVTEYFQPLCDREQYLVVREASATVVAYSDFGPWCPPWVDIVVLGAGQCEQVSSWVWPQQEGGHPDPGDGAQVVPGAYLASADLFDEPSPPHPFTIHAGDPPAIPAPGAAGVALFLLAIAFGGVFILSRWSSPAS